MALIREIMVSHNDSTLRLVSKKCQLLICRDKSNTPSGFTLKLRKHIRTRRLEDVRQLGYDRVLFHKFRFLGP